MTSFPRKERSEKRNMRGTEKGAKGGNVEGWWREKNS